MAADVAGDPRVITSFDGTPIAFRRIGEGDSVAVLLVNAIGADIAIWRRSIVDLSDEQPVIAWDHRGLYASGNPASDRIDAGAHAQDAASVLDHLGMERVSIVAWSNGGRIALDICDRYPERVTGLVMVCASYGQPLTALRFLEPSSLLPTIVGAAKHFAAFLEGPFRAFTSRPELLGLIRQSGIVGPTADTAAMVRLLRGMSSCDLHALLSLYEAVAGDAAPHLLRRIHVPALVIAGGKDVFTPMRMSREIADTIPDARLHVYETATHFLPIEFPDRLRDDVRSFLGAIRP